MTALPEELERLGQALALNEGFQIVLLECHGLGSWDLHRLFDLIQARVAELRGVPPLVVVYDPHVTTSEEGSLRDEAWVEGVLGPILRLPAPDAEGASVIAVIDGTGPASVGEVPSWTFLFHRMNERRNRIARTLVGTLVLALTPRLVRLFLSEASDSASIRSGMFRVDRGLVPEASPSPSLRLDGVYPAQEVHGAHVRRVVADPEVDPSIKSQLRAGLAPSAPSSDELRGTMTSGRYRALEQLLLSMFSADELRRFVRYHTSRDIAAELPEKTVSAAALVVAVIEAIERHGMLDDAFWAALRSERPRRRADIDEVTVQFEKVRLPSVSIARGVASVLYLQFGGTSFSSWSALPSAIEAALSGKGSYQRFSFEWLYVPVLSEHKMASLYAGRPRVLVFHDRAMRHDGDGPLLPEDGWYRLIRMFTSELRLLILIAPDAFERASRIANTIELVIGIDSASQEAVIAGFLRQFFEALARGESVESAFQLSVAAFEVDPTAGPAPVLLPAREDDVREARGRSLV